MVFEYIVFKFKVEYSLSKSPQNISLKTLYIENHNEVFHLMYFARVCIPRKFIFHN